jgi:AraC-like DNA-binding protein
MALNYSFLNLLILLGAIQGFLLCFFIYQKRKKNPKAVLFFILFLFSLAFLNFIYACLDLDLFRYYRPLHLFPLPYKWLIGIGFYFYVRYLFPSSTTTDYHKLQWYLFAPAIVYFLLRTYWFGISVKENSYRITAEIVNSNFFRYHEYTYLLFCLFLGFHLFKVVRTYLKTNQSVAKAEHINWVKTFIAVFMSIVGLNLLLFSIDLWIHDGEETLQFYYPILLINSIYIYWIGYIGFTKPDVLFRTFKTQHTAINDHDALLTQTIYSLIITEERFTNSEFSLHEAARILNVSPKKLSTHLNTNLGFSFSEFLNQHRIEKVKQLLLSDEADKYTLFSLAQQAGFKTKSSFNATFKRLTNTTPSAFKKANRSI